MSINMQQSSGYLPDGDDLQKNINNRQTQGNIWRNVFLTSLIVALVILVVLIVDILNGSFGLIAIQNKVDPATISDQPIETLSEEELVAILERNMQTSGSLRRLDREEPFTARDQAELVEIVETEVIGQEIVASWKFFDSVFNSAAIQAQIAEKYPRAIIEWHSWISWDFVTSPMSAIPSQAGISTAIMGSLWVIFITMIFAVPVGIGASIYLEEYSADTKNPMLQRINTIIETNINNLAGVPSIIYGILGLSIFVIALAPITSGVAFGVNDPTTANGRTIISAG